MKMLRKAATTLLLCGSVLAGGADLGADAAPTDEPQTSVGPRLLEEVPAGWSPAVDVKDAPIPQSEIDRAFDKGPRGEESASAAQVGCTPDTYPDNPHLAKNGLDVSGHGTWGKGTCKADRAWVTTRLYEWYVSSSGRGAWVFKAEGRKKVGAVKSEGYARANSRIRCKSKTRTSWMNMVDVDVVGVIDSSDRHHRKAVVSCRV